MSRPKSAKKVDKDAAPVAEAGQVVVKFTLDIAATPTLFVAVPCSVYDTRFSFTLLTSNPVTSPPTSTWQSATAASSNTAVRWTSDAELVVSKDTLQSMETEMLKVTIEQREAQVSDDTQPTDELASPSKASKSVKPPITSKKPKADKAASGDDERKSTAHPALTDDLPFTSVSSFLLPLSTLLAPPHSVAFTSSAQTSFVLPAGLTSMSCSLHANGTNPIHPSLLPTLLPLALSLTSLSSLPVPVAPSPYRPLSLSFTLPSHPHTFTAPSSLPVTTPDIALHPTLYPTRVVLLGRLSRSALYEAARAGGSGLLVEVRDREHKAIKTKEEVQEDEGKKREEDERREAEERERQKEEEKKKKSAKPAAIKSPKAANKQSKPEEPPTPLPQATPQVETVDAVAVTPSVVYDCRSNVYGVAMLSLAELFQSAVASAAGVDVVCGVRAVLPPADVPLMAPDRRTNPYTNTLLTARMRLLHPLPPISQLAEEVRYARAVAVWSDDDEASWWRVYSEILRLNAKALRVEDGESEGQGSWQWLEAVKAVETTQPAADLLEQKEDEIKADKEKEKAKAVKGKKELKASDAASAAPSPLPNPPRTLPTLTRSLDAGHITGCVVMDGRTRWLFIEGLTDGDAWKAMESVLSSERKSVQTTKPSSRLRVLLDSAMRFTDRSFVGCPLTLSFVRLTNALSSLQAKAAVASTCVLTLSALTALLTPQVVPDMAAACRTNTWLDAAGVKLLKERVGREAKLEEMYGKEKGKEEKEARKRKAKEVREKEEKERAAAEKLELDKQQQQADPSSAIISNDTTVQQPPQTQPGASTTADKPTTEAQPTDTAATQIQPTDATQTATDALVVTQPIEPTEATLSAAANTIVAKRKRATDAPHSAPTLPTYIYSNATEYQAALRSLRAACHADKNHHYTFHLQYLHSSVPICESIEEADKKERHIQKQQWRTRRGFVMPHSRVGQLFSQYGLLSEGERDKERSEKRRVRSVDELVEVAWEDRVQHYNTKRETQFYTQPLFPSLFDKSPQRSVHLSGTEQLRAEQAKREQEKREWESQVCVDDTAFHVLWGSGQNKVVNEEKESGEDEMRVLNGGCRLFGLRGLRKDEPVKQSLQFKGQMDGHGNRKPKQRQLVVEDLPVSITNVGEWHDPSQMQFRESEKRPGQAEFVRYVFPHQFLHKPHIQP